MNYGKIWIMERLEWEGAKMYDECVYISSWNILMGVPNLMFYHLIHSFLKNISRSQPSFPKQWFLYTTKNKTYFILISDFLRKCVNEKIINALVPIITQWEGNMHMQFLDYP